MSKNKKSPAGSGDDRPEGQAGAGAVSVIMLGKDCQLEMDQTPKELTSEQVRGVMIPVPCGCSPLLLIVAPEDDALRTRPSVSDILSSILGSLYVDLVGDNANRVLSRLRLYQDAGK